MEITTEIQALREECESLGIKYHHLHGEKKLQELVDAHRKEKAPKESPEEIEKVVPITQTEFKTEAAKIARKDANRLIRCRIQCLDPQKKEWKGELISVGSAKLGTIKKFVPFNTGEPYHLPKIIFDMLEERKCSFFYTEKDPLGHPVRKSKQGKAFALEILPPLNQDELQELGRRQALRQGSERVA